MSLEQKDLRQKNEKLEKKLEEEQRLRCQAQELYARLKEKVLEGRFQETGGRLVESKQQSPSSLNITSREWVHAQVHHDREPDPLPPSHKTHEAPSQAAATFIKPYMPNLKERSQITYSDSQRKHPSVPTTRTLLLTMG